MKLEGKLKSMVVIFAIILISITFPLNNNYNGKVSEFFNTTNYTIIFNETGLPNNTLWFVNLTNGQSFSSHGETILINEPNGTYHYIVSSANINFKPKPASGNFIVNGKNLWINIKFYPVQYYVNFVEQGLPAGTKWSVNINGTIKNSTSNTITFYLFNGSYSYYVIGIQNYKTTNSSGTFIIQGKPLTFYIYFTPYLYPVYFNLSNSNKINIQINVVGVEFNGLIYNKTINISNSIVLYLPNGSYSFKVSVPSGYNSNIQKGFFTVSGKVITENIIISSPGLNYPAYIIPIIIVILVLVFVNIYLWRKYKKIK